MVKDGHNLMQLLSEVMDPEIPVLSLVDLGVILSAETDGQRVHVKMRPTFTGCPAMAHMKLEVESRLLREGYEDVDVEMVRSPAWTTDDISEKGREALRRYGYAPPVKNAIIDDISFLEHVECPRCGGRDTELQNPFGPTLCRSIHYCNTCMEAFQQIKPLH